jgi:hypothetical protein
MKISVMDKKDTAIAISLAKFKELKNNLLITELDDVMRLCEEALEQPTQEPDYWLGYGLQAYDEKPHDDATPVYLRPAPQSAQEPVTCLDKMQSITEEEYYD